MDMLSALTLHGPSIGTPIILSLYLRPSTISIAVFIADNLDPKLEVSMEVSFLENQTIGAFWMNKKIPILDRLVTVDQSDHSVQSQSHIEHHSRKRSSCTDTAISTQ